MSLKSILMENAPSITRGDVLHDMDTVTVADAESEVSADMILRSFDKILDIVTKLDDQNHSQILSNEVNYLRQLVDNKLDKLDKLSAIVAEIKKNKNQQAILSSLHAMQNEQDAHNGSEGGDAASNVDQPGVHLDSNMDPELHQVAVAAAAVRAQQHVSGSSILHHHAPSNQHASTALDGDDRKRTFSEDTNGNTSSKKPKITIDFLHNPMTVREIYDEFTKGFRGQPALCELDARFGKHEWRGDLRSKQSKRYQRRKKLCDAITRGMQKYDKSADEIIGYIEEFRGDKLLTWVMNGNLPADLMG